MDSSKWHQTSQCELSLGSTWAWKWREKKSKLWISRVGSALTFTVLHAGEGHHTGNKRHSFAHAHMPLSHAHRILIRGFWQMFARYQLIRKKQKKKKIASVSCVNGGNICENNVVKVIIVVAVVVSVGVWKTLQVWADTLTQSPTARAPHIFTHSKQ